MRLLFAISCSIGIHILLVVAGSFFPFQSLKIENQTDAPTLNVTLKAVNAQQPINPFKINQAQQDLKPVKKHQASIASNKQPASLPFVRKEYFASNQVDIEALPINNIDAAMLDNIAYQGLQVKLRIFINASGNVDYVEPIKTALTQNAVLSRRISGLLYRVQFTPARRKAVDVKSFQEIAYDFNSYQTATR